MAVKSVSRYLDALARICYTEYSKHRFFAARLRKPVHHRVTQAESRKEVPHIQYNRLNYQKVNQNPREDLVSSAIDDDEF